MAAQEGLLRKDRKREFKGKWKRKSVTGTLTAPDFTVDASYPDSAPSARTAEPSALAGKDGPC